MPLMDTQKSSLKLLLGVTGEDEDALLELYLTIAGDKILARLYPYKVPDNAEIPVRYGALQLQIAAYLYGKRGAEGQTSHSENGIARAYENGDVPESMMREIVPFVGVM